MVDSTETIKRGKYNMKKLFGYVLIGLVLVGLVLPGCTPETTEVVVIATDATDLYASVTTSHT